VLLLGVGTTAELLTLLKITSDKFLVILLLLIFLILLKNINYYCSYSTTAKILPDTPKRKASLCVIIPLLVSKKTNELPTDLLTKRKDCKDIVCALEGVETSLIAEK